MFSKLFPILAADLITAVELILAADSGGFYFEAEEGKAFVLKMESMRSLEITGTR